VEVLAAGTAMRAGERKKKAVETWRGDGDQVRLVGEGLDGRDTRSDRREKRDSRDEGKHERCGPRGDRVGIADPDTSVRCR